MVPKMSHESRKLGELIVIVGIAALVLALGVVATRGFPGGDSNEGSVGSAPQPSATPVARPTVEPEGTRDPQDTWVPPEQFPGVEAIQPSLDTARPGEPRVTVRDVEAYVTHDYFGADGVDEIVSIEFLPAAVAEARIELGPGAYGGRLVCVVELRGSFPVRVPPDLSGQSTKTDQKLEAPGRILTFDALTGNLLSESIPPP